jgi:hypothetical protein
MIPSQLSTRSQEAKVCVACIHTALHDAHIRSSAHVEQKKYKVIATSPSELDHEVLELFTDSEKGD